MSVSVAVLVPDKVAPTVKLVVPHPLRTRFAGVAKLKVGSSRLMASDVASWTFRANVKVSADGAVVTGFTISSALTVNAGVGTATAVDVVMEVVSEMSVA